MARARNWVFTLNNPVAPIVFVPESMRYLIYQEEVGENGTHHYQGYVEFKSSCRMNRVKNLLGSNTIHVEKRRGTRSEARDYAQKEETRFAGPFVFGEWVEDGERTDLQRFYDAVKSRKSNRELIDEEPEMFAKHFKLIQPLRMAFQQEVAQQWRQLNVEVLIGPTGCGKTKKVYDTYPASSVYRIHQESGYWFSYYNGECTLLIDDFDGWIRYRYLLNLLDGHPLMLQTKGDHCWALWYKVVITSNVKVTSWYNHEIPELMRRITIIRDAYTGDNCPVGFDSVFGV